MCAHTFGGVCEGPLRNAKTTSQVQWLRGASCYLNQEQEQEQQEKQQEQQEQEQEQEQEQAAAAAAACEPPVFST